MDELQLQQFDLVLDVEGIEDVEDIFAEGLLVFAERQFAESDPMINALSFGEKQPPDEEYLLN
jgi:hypothetical protein